jgi:hypothetical protein
MLRATAAVLAAAAALPAAAAARTPSPSLQLDRSNGFVVIGSHFKAHERVTVSVLSLGARTGKAVANRGSFRLSFGTLPRVSCAPLRVVATGSLGSRAVLSYPARVCIQPGPGPGSSSK